MKSFAISCILFLFAHTAACAQQLENAITPLLEKYECIENLPLAKLTQNQQQEISQALERKAEKIRLATYNMLFDIYDHALAEENRWPNRLPRIVELVNHMQPDIITTQELYPKQVEDLLSLLAKDFSFYSAQKSEDGESLGIFYRRDRFTVLSSDASPLFAMLELKDLATDKNFYVFNTHMPFSNIEKRESAARKIAAWIEPFAQKNATLFTGDLNTFPARFDLEALPFYDGNYIHRILSQGSLKNTYETSLLGHFGPISTFTNKDLHTQPFQGTGTPGIFLDHIYASKRVTVLSHAIEPATIDGHFPSDHMPVLIDFLID